MIGIAPQISSTALQSFRPTTHQLTVRLGQVTTTNYYARNRAAQAVTGQAVPSVSPGLAAEYLRKVECFCFSQQHLEAGEERQMPLRFYISEDLPKKIHTLSLSYTLFKVPAVQPPRLVSNQS